LLNAKFYQIENYTNLNNGVTCFSLWMKDLHRSRQRPDRVFSEKYPEIAKKFNDWSEQMTRVHPGYRIPNPLQLFAEKRNSEFMTILFYLLYRYTGSTHPRHIFEFLKEINFSNNKQTEAILERLSTIGHGPINV